MAGWLNLNRNIKKTKKYNDCLWNIWKTEKPIWLDVSTSVLYFRTFSLLFIFRIQYAILVRFHGSWYVSLRCSATSIIFGSHNVAYPCATYGSHMKPLRLTRWLAIRLIGWYEIPRTSLATLETLKCDRCTIFPNIRNSNSKFKFRLGKSIPAAIYTLFLTR